MSAIWKNILIFISIGLNAVLSILLFSSEKEELTTPPWHPFELNSELSLESLVNDGYRFASMPCGQVQYSKQIGDTIIQYEVEIDCNSYEGKYSDSQEYLDLLEEDIVVDTSKTQSKEKPNVTSERDSARLKEIASNKFYPWKSSEISNCYQNINWRVYTINLGKSIDSISIRNIIENKGGYILEHASSWNSNSGGLIMVSYDNLNLYFQCFIQNDRVDSLAEDNWNFRIVRYIPKLDHSNINSEKEWRNLKYEYYKNVL